MELCKLVWLGTRDLPLKWHSNLCIFGYWQYDYTPCFVSCCLYSVMVTHTTTIRSSYTLWSPCTNTVLSVVLEVTSYVHLCIPR